MGSDRIDEIDAKILNLLQESGRMRRKTIAEAVGLTVPSVSERMRKLRERGVLKGYHAAVDAKRLQFGITAFIRITVAKANSYGNVIAQVCKSEEVLEMHSITGEGTHILKVRTHSAQTLEQLLAHIQSFPGVTGTHTNVVMSSFKETQRVTVRPTDDLAS